MGSCILNAMFELTLIITTLIKPTSIMSNSNEQKLLGPNDMQGVESTAAASEFKVAVDHTMESVDSKSQQNELDALASKCALLYTNRQWDEFLVATARFMQADSGPHHEIHYNRANAYRHLGRAEDCIRELESGIREGHHDDTDLYARVCLMHRLREVGRHKEALVWAESSLALKVPSALRNVQFEFIRTQTSGMLKRWTATFESACRVLGYHHSFRDANVDIYTAYARALASKNLGCYREAFADFYRINEFMQRPAMRSYQHRLLFSMDSLLGDMRDVDARREALEARRLTQAKAIHVDDSNRCNICCDALADTVFWLCGHTSCYDCYLKLATSAQPANRCHVCKNPYLLGRVRFW